MIGKRVRGMFDDVVKILTSQDFKKKKCSEVLTFSQHVS